jgi:hypothetical protein
VSGTINPLSILYAGDQTGQRPNALAPVQAISRDAAPTPADAWEYNAPVVADAARQAQNPEFWREAAQQYGNALLMGSTTPVGAKFLPKGGLMTKILDESGQPRVVYHGTTADFEHFNKANRGDNTEASGSHDAFFFAGHPNDTALYIEMAQAKAEANGEAAPSGRVIQAHLDAKKPLILSPFEDVNVPSHVYDDLIHDDAAAISYAKQNGHDAVIWPHGNATNSAYTAAVFDPEQIVQLPSK